MKVNGKINIPPYKNQSYGGAVSHVLYLPNFALELGGIVYVLLSGSNISAHAAKG